MVFWIALVACLLALHTIRRLRMVRSKLGDRADAMSSKAEYFAVRAAVVRALSEADRSLQERLELALAEVAAITELDAAVLVFKDCVAASGVDHQRVVLAEQALAKGKSARSVARTMLLGTGEAASLAIRVEESTVMLAVSATGDPLVHSGLEGAHAELSNGLLRAARSGLGGRVSQLLTPVKA